MTSTLIGDGSCPVPGCPRMAKVGHLMCIGHWSKVPALLRTDVNDAYRRYRRDQLSLEELREVQQAAIDVVSP